jgi:hypothetical protein
MSRSSDSEQLFCSAGDCLEQAVVFGRATLEVGALAGAASHEEHQAFSLPLRSHHARLLGYGNRLVDFSNGLLQNGRRH